MKSFAQFNEDKFIYDIFKKKNINSGVFVEFGAWDGVHFSNCKILADNNWSGFFIEANKKRFNQCQKNYLNYKKITILNKFICSNYTLDQLILDNNIKDIDVLSIDIDGKDLEELKKLSLVKPKIIIIEYNFSIPFDVECEDTLGGNGNSYLSINNYLKTKNYQLIEASYTNLVFIEKDFNENQYEEIGSDYMVNKLKPLRFGFNNYGEMFFIENKRVVKKEIFRFPTMKSFIMFQPIPKFIRNLTDENGKGYKLIKILYSNFILLILRPNYFLKKLFFKMKK